MSALKIPNPIDVLDAVTLQRVIEFLDPIFPERQLEVDSLGDEINRLILARNAGNRQVVLYLKNILAAKGATP